MKNYAKSDILSIFEYGPKNIIINLSNFIQQTKADFDIFAI